LDQVARIGSDLAASLNRASEGLRQLRSDADRTIGSQIANLNQTLKDIEDLNARIPAIRNSGGDINAFLDQRQVLIDQVNELIPVNVVPRDNDHVSVYSDGGLILLEGKAAEFSFTTTGDTQPHMTVGNGVVCRAKGQQRCRHFASRVTEHAKALLHGVREQLGLGRGDAKRIQTR
jgi:flagellar hook-associated protein 1 FlgK